MPQHSPTMATLRPYCVSFYRINPAKSLIMQDKLTTSPLPLTPPDTGAEKQAHDVLWKNRMKLTFCQRSKWKCVPQQIPCSGRLGKDTRLQEYRYTHTHTQMYLSRCFTHKMCLFGMHFHEVAKWSWRVFHHTETCKPSFSVHLNCRVHGLLPWNGEMLDLFWFFSFVHFRNLETILPFFTCFISIPYWAPTEYGCLISKEPSVWDYSSCLASCLTAWVFRAFVMGISDKTVLSNSTNLTQELWSLKKWPTSYNLLKVKWFGENLL